MPIRILLVDDHAMFRQALGGLLALDPDLEICGEAEDGAEALRRIEELMPDLVLMDLNMPVMDGLTAIRESRSRFPTVPVLALTSAPSDSALPEAVGAGACGYLVKHARPEGLRQAIKAAVAGQEIQVVTSTTAAGEPLTERETEVLELVAKGMSNQQIADSLQIAERTVKSHVSSLLQKKGARTRTQLAVLTWKREGPA